MLEKSESAKYFSAKLSRSIVIYFYGNCVAILDVNEMVLLFLLSYLFNISSVVSGPCFIPGEDKLAKIHEQLLQTY